MREMVEVEWIDSESNSSWMSLRQALTEADPESRHRSCGYLLIENDRYILLALSYRPADEWQNEYVADTLRIPRVAVVTMHRLQKENK